MHICCATSRAPVKPGPLRQLVVNALSNLSKFLSVQAAERSGQGGFDAASSVALSTHGASFSVGALTEPYATRTPNRREIRPFFKHTCSFVRPWIDQRRWLCFIEVLRGPRTATNGLGATHSVELWPFSNWFSHRNSIFVPLHVPISIPHLLLMFVLWFWEKLPFFGDFCGSFSEFLSQKLCELSAIFMFFHVNFKNRLPDV